MNAREGIRNKTLVLALLFVCMDACAQSDTWKTYSYPADGFSIGSPNEPQMSQQSVPTDAGTFTVHMYSVSLENVQLIAAMNDYGSAVNGRDPKTVVDGAMNGAVANVNGHIIQSSSITIGNNPGNSYEAETDQAHISGRVYLVGSVLYQLMVITPRNQSYASTARFLDSFQLIPRGQS
jgi:hypothetical protein